MHDQAAAGIQVVTIDGLETVPPKDEVALMKGVTMHPITVALCVGDWIKDWRAYTGGILHTPGGRTRSIPGMGRAACAC